MKSHRFTYVLVFLVLGTLGLAFARQAQTTPPQTSREDHLKQEQERKSRFPTADYNEPDSPDPNINRLRKEKQARYNDFHLVSTYPPTSGVEVVFVGDGLMAFP